MVYPVLFSRLGNELNVWIQRKTFGSVHEHDIRATITKALQNDTVVVVVSKINGINTNGYPKTNANFTNVTLSPQIVRAFNRQAVKKQHIPTVSKTIHGLWTFNDEPIISRGRKQSHQDTINIEKSMYFECRNFTYDPADYTLEYFGNATLQKEPCEFPYDKTVKKIVNSDNSVTWSGCTNKTKSCRERARYDSAASLRLNTPPCCRRHLLEMLGNLAAILTTKRFEYFLVFGGVIGWYRNRKVIPYDRDLDVIIDGRHWYKITRVLSILKKQYGYIYHTPEREKIKLQLSSTNDLTIDIWPYFLIQEDLKPTDVIVNHVNWRYVPEYVLFPPKIVTFDGDVKVNVPNKVKDYLDITYGVGKWEKELNCTRILRNKCIE